MSELTGQTRAHVCVTPPTGWDTRSFAAMLSIIREDLRSNPKGLLAPAKQMLAVHRFGEWAGAQPPAVRPFVLFIFRCLNVYVRNALGFEVDRTTRIGRRVVFVHQNGLVLQPACEIGDDCMVYHQVTVGRRWEDDRPDRYREPPKIGKGVHIGVGATIIGAVRIGDGAKVGPHAVVTTDVPAGASVLAPASRVMRLRLQEDAS